MLISENVASARKAIAMYSHPTSRHLVPKQQLLFPSNENSAFQKIQNVKYLLE
jgi:hypothetical protein